VIISDWDSPARLSEGDSARKCSEDELKMRLWWQLTEALSKGDRGTVLRDEDLCGWEENSDSASGGSPPTSTPMPGPPQLESQSSGRARSGPPPTPDEARQNRLRGVLKKAAHVDANLLWTDEHRTKLEDGIVSTPLFIHPRGSQRLRPDAQLRIPNLLLASDYVRTFTDLATMEAANEAARRAVLAILRRETVGSTDVLPKLWPLTEGTWFDAAKTVDQWLYLNGQPHMMDMPSILSTLCGTAFDGVLQAGRDLLGLRSRVKAPSAMARRIVATQVGRAAGELAGRSLGIPRPGPEMTARIVNSTASVLLSGVVETLIR
jgi:hypothetical protein